jgi:hypothetical protein
MLFVRTDAQNNRPDFDEAKRLENAAKRYQYKDLSKAFTFARQGLSLTLKEKDYSNALRFYKLLGNLTEKNAQDR